MRLKKKPKFRTGQTVVPSREGLALGFAMKKRSMVKVIGHCDIGPGCFGCDQTGGNHWIITLDNGSRWDELFWKKAP